MPGKTVVGKSSQPAARQTLPKPGPSAEEEQDHQQTVASGGRGALFNETAAEEGFDMPLGTFRAYLTGAERSVALPKVAVKIEYEITQNEDEELNGKKLVGWYNFFDKNGAPQRGIGFWKKDCGLLERESPTLDENDEELEGLDPFLRELTDERPLCVVIVKKNGQGYINLFLQGLAAD